MTPAAALLDRLLDIVVTTELDQPGRISVRLAVLALAISKLPAAERDDACDGSPLMELRAPVTAGYGLAVTCVITWLWSCDDRRRHE